VGGGFLLMVVQRADLGVVAILAIDLKTIPPFSFLLLVSFDNEYSATVKGLQM
jgi:hypothetical protein